MPQPKHNPSYRLHKQSGQAIVTLTDGLGGRQDVLLGKYGTKRSLAEYDRVLVEWLSAGRQLPGRVVEGQAGLTINELALAYLRHADEYYRRPDGTPTSELDEMRLSLRPVCHLYGHTPAEDFGAKKLKAVRLLMVKGYDHPKYGPQTPLARGTINHRVHRIKRVFLWAVENELVPEGISEKLRAVRGLRRGRTGARETESVKPVSEAVVAATFPYLNRQVKAMIQVQSLTGMRPGEVCIMRACDLDMSGKVWLYRPGSDQGQEGQHKTAHHGFSRIIALGPRAQEVVRPFLKLETRAYLFSPKDVMAERCSDLRKNRKTKVQPSQQNRKKRKPRKVPGERYTTLSYGKCILKACDRAFPPPEPLARQKGETLAQWQARLTSEQRQELKAWRKTHQWHPHQLRHSTATKLRREFGLDTARVVLGHRSPQITETYAEIDVNKAAEVMGKIG